MGSLVEEIRTEAEKQGEKQGRLKVLIELVRDGLISTEVAADCAQMSVEEFEESSKIRGRLPESK